MEREFVPYELAVKLKELGFDEPCFGHFGSITEPEELQIFPNTESCLEPEDMTNSNLDYGLSCTAPTFSQAFRWFREGGYDTKIEKESEGLYFAFYWTGVAWIIIGNGSYREAEIQCLNKLIEITFKSE